MQRTDMGKNDTMKIRKSSLGWMIQRVARRLDKAMSARLSEQNLSLQQFAVMMIVLENDGQTQAMIGNNFGMPAYAISRALDHLEYAGFLERRAHPTSRRTHTIHATKPGKMLGPELYKIVKEVNDELAVPFSAEERSVFAEMLSRLT